MMPFKNLSINLQNKVLQHSLVAVSYILVQLPSAVDMIHTETHFYTFPLMSRDGPWDRGERRRSYSDGSYREPCIRSGNGQDSDRKGDCSLHPLHHCGGGFSRPPFLLHRFHPWLRMARRRHLSHRNHRCQCSWGSSCYCNGWFDTYVIVQQKEICL